MTIQNPQCFSAAFAEVCFRIAETAGDDPLLLTLLRADGQRTLGVRRFPPGDLTVDFGPVLRGAFAPEGRFPDASGFRHETSRTLDVRLAVGDLLSEPCTVVAATRAGAAGDVLCAVPGARSDTDATREESDGVSPDPSAVRLLPRSGADELALLCAGGETLSADFLYRIGGRQYVIAGGTMTAAAPGIYAYGVNASRLAALVGDDPALRLLRLVLRVDGRIRYVRRYRLVGAPAGARLLGWLNERGGCEYHLFRRLELRAEVDRERIVVGEEGRTLHARSRERLLLSSGYVNADEARRIAGMLASPCVWLRGDDGEALPVLVEERAVPLAAEDPVAIALTVMPQTDSRHF